MDIEGRKGQDHAALTPDDEAVSRLLGGLRRVEAPGDFDFRVKSHIAAGRPDGGSWFPAFARVGVPVALLLVVSGYFGFSALYPSASNVASPSAPLQAAGVAPVLGTVPAVTAAEPPAPETAPSDPLFVKAPSAADTINPRTAAVRNVSTRHLSAPQGGGFIDEAQHKGVEIYPKGIEPNPKPAVEPTGLSRTSALPAKDVLSSIGVDASYSGTAWTVGGIKQHSLAERSGLKAGDVIESINGQALAAATAFTGGLSLKSVRVRRGGKIMQVVLKP